MQLCYFGVSCNAQPETRWLPEFRQVMEQNSKTFFDGDESKYELWEVKFLGCLKIQHLHPIILSPTDQSDDIDFIENKATVFAVLIQYLGDRNLSLVVRYARDNGRKAFTILREYYLSKGKPNVISFYTKLTGISLLQTI